MMWGLRFRVLSIALSCVLVLSAPIMAMAEDIGRVKIVRGEAFIVQEGVSMPAEVGMALTKGATLVTGSTGRMGLTFKDNTRFAMGPDSEVSVDEFTFDSTTHAGTFDSKITKGSLSVVSGKIAKADSTAMTMRTPTKVLGVRGTNFLIEVQ